MQEQINYSDVIELGFKRQDMDDQVFFNQNGYSWFLVTKKLTKGIVAEWDCEKKTVELVKYNKKSDVLGRLQITSLKDLIDLIDFFNC